MPRIVPKRTAWSTPHEFRLVFDRLFASEGNVHLQQDAIGRIKVWLHRGHCPHAVESTAALLQLILRDAEPSTSAAAAVSEHELRLSYSMAIIRFVNTLVDPLQTTYFARSIASLAAQIGLPTWFVELRHQATHEDLPSIAVLRDAARQALDWLYANYWLPALNSSSATSTLAHALPPLPLSTLRPLLLTTYKSLAKQITRDASIAGRLKADVQKAYKDVERWIVENSLGGGLRGGKKEEEARERALEAVAEVLWEEGGLVPLAKKKRPTTRSPNLPAELRSLWTPLLAHFDALYDGALSDAVTRKGLDLLCSGVPSVAAASEKPAEGAQPGGAAGWNSEATMVAQPQPQETAAAASMDRTYAACVVAWLIDLLRDAPLSSERGDEADEEKDLLDMEEEEEESDGKDLTIKGVIRTCMLSRSLHTLPLLESLLATLSDSSTDTTTFASSSSDPPQAQHLLADRIKPLLPLLRAQASATSPNDFGAPRRVESAEEAEKLVREMENRAEEVRERLIRARAGGAQGAGGERGSVVDGAKEEEVAAEENGEDVEMDGDTTGATKTPGAGKIPWVPVQLWRKRPVGALPKGGVLALDLAPWPPANAASATLV